MKKVFPNGDIKMYQEMITQNHVNIGNIKIRTNIAFFATRFAQTPNWLVAAQEMAIQWKDITWKYDGKKWHRMYNEGTNRLKWSAYATRGKDKKEWKDNKEGERNSHKSNYE